MSPTELEHSAPAWLRHLHPDGYGYGWLLGLILLSLIFQLGAPDDDWARSLTIVIQSVTLVAALRISRVHRWILRVCELLAGVAILSAAGIVISTGELGVEIARSIGLLLVLLAPAAIVLGIVRQARRDRAVTIRTMFGVLCVYLLIGMAFGLGYGLIAALSDQPFFIRAVEGTQADFLYFSFATMTTVGYGDLAAATNLGRSFAITEALIGQIYIVTVVALIVSNLGRTRASAG